MLSPYLTSAIPENWDDAFVIYSQLMDEFQDRYRQKWYCVRWLFKEKIKPRYERWERWHWYSSSVNREDGGIFDYPFLNYFLNGSALASEYQHGMETFFASINWFCSLWPRYYVEVVLPTQENEPEDAEAFWENLNLCVPGEDWQESIIPYQIDLRSGARWLDGGKYCASKHYSDACQDSDYRWTYGNSVRRAIEAWKGESK